MLDLNVAVVQFIVKIVIFEVYKDLIKPKSLRIKIKDIILPLV